MKGRKMRMMAWLLLSAVLALEICGNRTFAYAMQSETIREAETGITAEPEGTDQTDEAELEERQQETPEAELEEGQQETPEAELAFTELLQENAMYGTLMNGSKIAVYGEPSLSAPVVQNLSSGYQVQLLGVVIGEDALWYQVAFGVNGQEYTGYVRDDLVVTQDERLAEWKNQYFSNDGAKSGAGVNAATGKTDLSAFPSSYRSKIKKLIAAHPNWTFVPMNTGLNWSDVITNEMVDARNLVSKNAPVTWKATDEKSYDMNTGEWIIKDGSSWVQASESIVKYYIDPRNFLNEDYVFMFEQLTYNKSCHTEAGVEMILKGTFMSKKKLEDGSGGNITYAKAFMKIGKELNVSPYFLASRVRQEQGVNGTSGLISGTYPGYKGYYNYFNIMATGIGDQVIINGLKEAQAAGWTTRYAALYGGAQKTAANYIAKGQDTFYLQKFDVDASYNGLYWHQYMQNVSAAQSECKGPRNSYIEMGAINNSFVFKVPVYTSMPSSACPDPGDKLKKPSVSVTKPQLGVVKLSWKEIGGAQGYQVYRKEGEDGKYKRIKTLKGLTKTSFQDKNALPGKVYYYKVRAYLKLSSGNIYSSYAAVKQADCTVSAATLKKCTKVDANTVKLTWTKADVTGYRIYRKTDGGKYVRIKTIKKGSTSTYKDTNVQKGHTYTYRIRAYLKFNDVNYNSVYSKTKKVQIK